MDYLAIREVLFDHFKALRERMKEQINTHEGWYTPAMAWKPPNAKTVTYVSGMDCYLSLR